MNEHKKSLYEKTYILTVSSQSRPAAVAGAIAGLMRDRNHAEMQAIGAAAVNQAVKAVAIARRHLTGEMDIVIAPEFRNIEIDGVERTSIYMEVIRR